MGLFSGSGLGGIFSGDNLGGVVGDIFFPGFSESGKPDPLGIESKNKEENRLKKKKLLAVQRKLDQAKLESRIGFAKAANRAGRSLPVVQKAYADARQNLAASATATRRDLSSNEASRMAASRARADASGWGNSTLANLADRGIRGDTARSLGALDRMYADAFSSLATQEAGAVSGINNNVASLLAGDTQALTALNQGQAQAIGSTNYNAPPSQGDIAASNIGALMSIFQLFGSFFGGGGGGNAFANQGLGGGFQGGGGGGYA